MKEQPLIVRPATLLRLEAFLVLMAGCASYQRSFPHHWTLFACLFLIPDVSLIPYLRGPTTSASMGYNLAHSYMLPALLGATSLYTGNLFFGEATLIWISHIAMDRTLGYGLKYANSSTVTHLQNVGLVAPSIDR